MMERHADTKTLSCGASEASLSNFVGPAQKSPEMNVKVCEVATRLIESGILTSIKERPSPELSSKDTAKLTPSSKEVTAAAATGDDKKDSSASPNRQRDLASQPTTVAQLATSSQLA